MKETERCSNCGGDSKVNDSRVENGMRVRRRVCLKCGYRWNTVEISEEDYTKMEIKAARYDLSSNFRKEQKRRQSDFEKIENKIEELKRELRDLKSRC